MPWVPELFTAPALQQMLDERRRERFITVPFFDGLMIGETDALVGSFAGVPELHHPVRGRIRGVSAFEAYVAEVQRWMTEHNVSVDDVGHIVSDGHGCGEAVLRLDGRSGPTSIPVAIVSDRRPDGRIDELRMYFSNWPSTGRHANRPPLLQRDPELREPDVVGEYQHALADGNVDGIVAAFEPDGYVREPAGDAPVHRGPEGLRTFYESVFSSGGGIGLEPCTVVDDGRACALEYNVVRWGGSALPPQAGVAVYVRSRSGRLASARMYDDVEPPPGPPV